MLERDKIKISEYAVRQTEGVLTAEEFEHLNSILASSPEAARYYCKIMLGLSNIEEFSLNILGQEQDNECLQDQFWAVLGEHEKTAPTVTLPKEKPPRELIQKVVYPPREKYKISKFNIFTFIMTAAAILLFVLLVTVQPPWHNRPVASITADYNAVWEIAENVDGTRLWNDGTMHYLKKGVVELTFDSGASVLIESPSHFEVLDKNRMYFEGRLTAQVPQSAHNFTVETPLSKVVDLGTEFGLTTSLEKGTEVHVRKGKVEHMLAGTKKASKHVLNAGQANRVNAKGSFSRVEFAGEQFLWDGPTRYEMAVIETKPVAYYRFEKGFETLAFNAIDRMETESSYAGSVNFASGLDIAPEFQSQSLYFAGDAETEVFIAGGGLTNNNALTISLWVRPERINAGIGRQKIITNTNNDKDVRERFTNQIYLTDDSRVGFYLFDGSNVSQKRIETEMSVSPNRWYHITASYADEEMKLYVNGQLQASKTIGIDFSPQYFERGFWAIGTKTGDPAKNQHLPIFKGAVDEISFYKRQLSDVEIKMLYRVAKEK